MPDAAAYRGALEAIDRILNRGSDSAEVLRAAFDVVRERTGFEVVGTRSGELAVKPEPDDEARVFLDRVALLVSAHTARVPPNE